MEYTYQIEINTLEIGDNFYGNLIDSELNKFNSENPTAFNQTIAFDRGEDLDGVTIFTIKIQYDNN